MKPKRIERLFYALAELAVNHGMESSLGDSLAKSKAEALNGFLTDNKSRASSLTLRCWWPQPAADLAEADEEADSDDVNDD